MPRRNYQLNTEELEKIEQVIQDAKDSRAVKRATALRMLHHGHSAKEAAQILQVSEVTVYNWHDRWLEEGVDGLWDQDRSGRPPKADDAYRQAIDDALESDPADHDYAFAIWTVERLREHLARETGTTLSYTRLWEVMQEMDYVYRRPTEDLEHAQDSAAHEQAKRLLDELKRGPSRAILNSSLWTKRP